MSNENRNGQWNTKLLHTLAELIETLIQQFDSDQLVSNIVAAKNSGVIHPIDPLDRLDLHKMINIATSKHGHDQKPMIHFPTEMAFLRAKISIDSCPIRKNYANIVRKMGPEQPHIDNVINSLLSQMRYYIKTHSAEITKATIVIDEHRSTMTEKIKTEFERFITKVKGVGIVNN